MSSLIFCGSFEKKVLPDLRKFYRSEFDKDISEEEHEILEEKLEFELNINHKIDHEILKAQRIKVYGFDNLNWKKKGKLLMPLGNLEKRIEFDMGEIFLDDNIIPHILLDLLDITFNNSNYKFKLKPCNKYDPLQYKINSYNSIDGKLFGEFDIKTVTPLFDSKPIKFRKYISL